jgi:pimeloyl-ACP methyl ester carboxylesterase
MVAVLMTLTNHLARTSLQLTGYRSRRVRTSTGRVHVLDARGRGHLPPVVLLHGISSAGVHFLPLLYRLRGRVRRLIVPDLPAHGFSDRPTVIRPEVLKDALVEAMDAVIDEPAVLFGNSMGGIAAVHYALARPERVRGLILCSPSGAAMDEAELRRFVGTFALDTHEAALGFVDRLFSRKNRMRHLFAWGVRRQFQAPEVRSLLSSTSPADLLTPEQLSSLRMPVLVLWGKDERILPRHHLDYFRAHLPAHARFEEPEGFGHAPHLDDADAVARRILAFTAEVHELAPAPSISRLRAA